MLKICIRALGSDRYQCQSIPDPAHNVGQVLGYILDLIPHDEMDFLDEAKRLLSEMVDK